MSIKNEMTSNQANSISIKDFLDRINIRKKGKSYYGMYFSPFRAETVPSLKVDYRKNLWYDFGSGEGGTMIDLVMKLYRCNFPEAMKILESGNTPDIILPSKPSPQTEKTILRDVRPLYNLALIAYLEQRGINTDMARGQCVEVHYSVNSKKYYAVGFRNDSDGYELRNRYFKGSVSPKDITTFSMATDNCMIFEGFMDYLSYLTMENQFQPQMNTVVLNSTAHLERAMTFLMRHQLIHAYLDNDTSGKEVLSEINKQHGYVDDMSVIYYPYKDLNEYLVKQLIN
jgi:DNA primase